MDAITLDDDEKIFAIAPIVKDEPQDVVASKLQSSFNKRTVRLPKNQLPPQEKERPSNITKILSGGDEDTDQTGRIKEGIDKFTEMLQKKIDAQRALKEKGVSHEYKPYMLNRDLLVRGVGLFAVGFLGLYFGYSLYQYLSCVPLKSIPYIEVVEELENAQ